MELSLISSEVMVTLATNGALWKPQEQGIRRYVDYWSSKCHLFKILTKLKFGSSCNTTHNFPISITTSPSFVSWTDSRLSDRKKWKYVLKDDGLFVKFAEGRERLEGVELQA